MPVYQYSNPSLLERVEVIANDQGGLRAYLYARPDAPPEQLGQLKQALGGMGWGTLPYTEHGRASLEVRGFNKTETLIGALERGGWAQQPSAPKQVEGERKTLGEKFRSATLRWTGLAYLFGDAAFMTYATMEMGKNRSDLRESNALLKAARNATEVKTANNGILSAKEAIAGSWSKLVAGLGYAAGSAVLYNYGSKDQSQAEIKNATRKVEGFIRKEGFGEGEKAGLLDKAPEPQQRGFFGRMHQLLGRYPSESLNLIYAGVGLLLMRASVKAMKAPQKIYESGGDFKKRVFEEGLDIGLGVVTATSAAAGLLIREKKPIPGEEKRTGLAGIWDWIQEKPLRATGYGYMVATGIHGVVTASKYKWKPLTEKDHRTNRIMLGRAIFVGLNIAAEALMVISSKGHGEGVKNADVDTSVIASTASYVAKQDPAMQAALIERLAGYMASPDVLGGRADEIAGRLREQVAGVQHNPWMQAGRPNHRIGSVSSAGKVQAAPQAAIATA